MNHNNLPFNNVKIGTLFSWFDDRYLLEKQYIIYDIKEETLYVWCAAENVFFTMPTNKYTITHFNDELYKILA